MGADIYYEGPRYKEEKKLWEALRAVEDPDAKERLHLLWKKSYDQLDEDYFRDSYNNTSVFWQMGLSWWADVGKVTDEDSRLPIFEAIKLREYIENHPITREGITWEDYETKQPVILTEKDRTDWFDYFEKKREDFLKMLDRSIENDSPLICSV